MQSLGCDYVFQHRYGKKWICYTDPEIQIINKALKRNQKKVTLPSKDPKKQIVVNFENMLQKNTVSNVEQNIRALIYTQNFYAWMWMEEDEFFSFRPFQVYALEAAFQQNLSEIKFYNNGDCKVDLKTLKLINEETNDYTPVIREKVILPPTPGIREIVNQNKTLLDQMCRSDFLKNLCKESRIFDTSMSSRKSFSLVQRPELLPLEDLLHSTNILPENLITSNVVDKECPNIEKYQVYSAGKLFYSAALSCTSIENNMNKYLILQVLENDGNYFLWQRWGRIGYKPQTHLATFGKNLIEASEAFQEIFNDKTRNDWKDVLNFRHVPGKYDMLQMDLSPEAPDESMEVESQLPTSVKDLLSLITNRKMMNQIMEDLSFDLKNAPLGKLTVAQIREGYLALSKIVEIITSNGKGKDLISACDEFYTKIPHSFGKQKPPILSTLEDVDGKLIMLEALMNIRIAVNIFAEPLVTIEHPLDRYYRSLECELRQIDPLSREFMVIQECLFNSHGITHTDYEMVISGIFACNKLTGEKYANYGNKLLLWHGSRLTNWVGILKEGLQIAPPEAPSTGAMFGKGLYFADSSSKSANYCFATKKQNMGLLLLCEVCLGTSLDLFHAVGNMPYYLPNGYQSVTGRGRFIPSGFKTETFLGDSRLPVGPLVKSGVSSCLDYNEYVVYSTSQVKMKYLILVKFNFMS